MHGTLNEEVAFADFEEALDTLSFDTVPSNPEAKLETSSGIDWKSVAITGAVGGVIGAVIALINRNKRKRKAKEEK